MKPFLQLTKGTRVSFIFLLWIVSSCSDNNTTIPERVRNTPDSKIAGTVTLYDDLFKKVSPLGMAVTIEGTEFTDTTDSRGKYTFKDVPYGTYNLIFSKAGYGTNRIDTFKHIDNNDQLPTVVPDKILGQISTTAIIGLSIESDVDTMVVHPFCRPAATKDTSRGVRLFYGTSASVSALNYSGYSEVYALKNSPGAIKIAKQEFYGAGFASGTTVYVRVYGESFVPNDYVDLNTSKRIFPNLNAATVEAVSFVLP